MNDRDKKKYFLLADTQLEVKFFLGIDSRKNSKGGC